MSEKRQWGCGWGAAMKKALEGTETAEEAVEAITGPKFAKAYDEEMKARYGISLAEVKQIVEQVAETTGLEKETP